MKKLVFLFTLLLCSLSMNAQDGKWKHMGAGTGISASTYLMLYTATEKHDIAHRGSWMTPVLFAFAWEVGNVYVTGGEKDFSFKDIGWTILGGAASSLILRTVFNKKYPNKRRRKRKLVYQEWLEEVEYEEFVETFPLVKK